MLILWIVIILFMSFIGVLLWTPLRLVIDSTRDVYRFEWKYICSAMLMEQGEDLGVQIQVLFFKKFLSFDWFFQKISKPRKQAATTKTFSQSNRDVVPTSVSKRRFRPNIKKMFFSFEIKRCRINWDTDDYVLNAYLYPIAFFLFKRQKGLTINFEGKRDIDLIVENRLGRIITSFF